MQENFARADAQVLQYEGGKSDNPRDPGGKTNQGITQGTYNAWRRSQGLAVQDVYLMTDVERDAIYKSEYWVLIQGDLLPTGVDLVVYDGAVNSGVAQSVKWLQSALGTAYTGKIDGVMGTLTLDALKTSGESEDSDIVEAICSRRLAMLKRLSTWGTFGTGWSARVANVQKTALAWIDSAPLPPVPDIAGAGGNAKAPVSTLKPPIVSQVTAHVTTVATGASTVASQAATQVQGVQDYAGWIKWLFGALTVAAAIGGVVAYFATQANSAVTAGTATATVDLDADTNLPVKT
jgi:lysozyme family protein